MVRTEYLLHCEGSQQRICLTRNEARRIAANIAKAAGVGAAGVVKLTRYRFQLLGRERGSGGGELSPLL